MDGFPILDYTPATLLGIGVLLVLLGGLVPSRSIKPMREEIAYLRSALQKEQQAHAETVRQNGELLETNKLVRAVFESLERAVE